MVWSRGSRAGRAPAFAPDAIHRRHPHLTVTAITPFGLDGPWRDRPATEFTLQAWSGGIVGLGRGIAGPGAGVRRRPGRRVARRAPTPARHAGVAALRGGSGELVDLSMLETPDPRPHLLPGDLLRDARAGRGATRGGSRCPASRAAKDGLVDIGCGTGAAVVRPVRDDRPPGVDRRGLAAVDHRAGQRAGRRTLRVGGRARPSTRSATSPRRSGSRTRRSPTAPTSTSLDHFVARGSFVAQSARRLRPARPARTACTGATSRRRNRRRASASTPSTTAEMASGSQTRPESTPQTCRFGSDCRSTGCACST